MSAWVDPEPLDWRDLPLADRALLEASAGTGKTYNIGLIFLRLLLEGGLDVRQILVTTFTDAAAQELRERLRSRLVEAERWLRERSRDAPCSEPMPGSLEDWLAARCSDAADARTLLRRVQLAQMDFDGAPIATIHAFCQRVLRDFPFASRGDFRGAELVDEGDLLRECFEDFWRCRYLAATPSPLELEAVVEKGPDALFRDLKPLFAQAELKLIEPDLQPLYDALDGLSVVESQETMRAWIDEARHFRRDNAALRSRLRELAEAATTGHAADRVTALAALAGSIGDDNLGKQLTADGMAAIAGHGLFADLCTAARLARNAAGAVRGRVLAEAYRFCRDEMPRRAARRGLSTYGMLIARVHAGLAGAHGTALADALFAAYPAALIDEFQDTDPRQYDIFDRIYRDRGLLVMIGDPKQAIYGFRGGDVAAYLRAREGTPVRRSIARNFRSSAAYVAALNALYALAGDGFAHAAIRYVPVAASDRLTDTPYRHGGQAASPLVLHVVAPLIRENGKPDVGSTSNEPRLLALCADRIAGLLNDPHARLGERRVRPGDIAVLLPTNRAIRALREQLVARGVPCIGNGRGNVFATEVARELQLVLHAALQPGDEAAVRAALATQLLGVDLEGLVRLGTDAAAWERELERFADWREIWRRRGILAVIEALMAAAAPRLIACAEGERWLTDLRHLGELLAAEAAALYGPAELYAWYARTRAMAADEETPSEERQLRLESEAARVQLVTLHASKGLEYPIVFLPLAWRTTSRSGPFRPRSAPCHDAQGRRVMDLGSADFEANLTRHFREDLEERLRQCYVALTRATHACHLFWLDLDGAERREIEDWATPALGHLLDRARQTLAERGLGGDYETLGAAVPGLEVHRETPGAPVVFALEAMPVPPRVACGPLPAPRRSYWLHSFSGLVRGARQASEPEHAASDEATPTAALLAALADDGTTVAAIEPVLAELDALRGPRFGDAVHGVFEHAAPGVVWPVQRGLLEAQLALQAIQPPDDQRERLLAAIGRMVERVRTADLGGGLRLGALAAPRRVAEFEFQFAVERGSLAALRRICAAHGGAGVVPETLGDAALNGLMKGYIDLVFEWDGRYHVLDYKTNRLGARLADYRATALDAAMDAHHYRLQALLYSVALHRYLRQRVPDYRAERHLGASWYLFVRAAGVDGDAGIWRGTWPVALIEALDAGFAGGWEQAA
mgnify:CR=1 FL=1